jgi:subtilisin family serine protease
MLRIGVIDTGAVINFVLQSNILNGIGIRILTEHSDYVYESDYSDHHGHGTEVASLLSVLCPEVPLVAVRIAQQDDSGLFVCVPEKILALGIDWCIEQGIRLINVSYSIESLSESGILAEVCQKAKEKNVIIVAAYRNNTKLPVYPASFPNVIGVSILENSEHGQISIVSEQNHDVAVFGGPYQVASINNEIKIVCGTSFAAVQVTGMAGRMLAIKPTLTFQEVFRYLKKYSI